MSSNEISTRKRDWESVNHDEAPQTTHIDSHQLPSYKRIRDDNSIEQRTEPQYQLFDYPEKATILLTEQRSRVEKPFNFNYTSHVEKDEQHQFSVGKLRGPNASGLPIKIADESSSESRLRDGGPVWTYCHEHLMKEVFRALRAVAEMQPENPFQYMGEYFMRRGRTLPIAETLRPEMMELYWHMLDNEIGDTKLSTIAIKAPQKTELEEWNEETEALLERYTQLSKQYESVSEPEKEPEVDDSIFLENLPDRIKHLSEQGIVTAEVESQATPCSPDATIDIELLKKFSRRRSSRLHN